MILQMIFKIIILIFFSFFTNQYFARLLGNKGNLNISFIVFCGYFVLFDYLVLGLFAPPFFLRHGTTILQAGFIDVMQIIVSQLLVFAIVSLLFKGNAMKKLAISSIYFVVWQLVGSGTAAISQILNTTVQGIGGETKVVIFAFSTLRYAATCFLLYQISKRCEYLSTSLPRKISTLLFIPSFFILLILELVSLLCGDIQVFYYLGALGESANVSLLFKIADLIIVCFASLLGLMANMMIVFAINDAMRQLLTTSQLEMQVEHYRDLQANNQKLQSLRHDMKNHLITLSGLLSKDDLSTAKEYMNHLIEESGVFGRGIETGNTSVDALINTKQTVAVNCAIQFVCKLQIPNIIKISDFDLCVILGNALDNALEACQRISVAEERFITIESCIVRNYLVIEVKNSTNEKEQTHKNIASQKMALENHGIGLTNIKATIARHFGVMNITHKNYVFDLSLMLPVDRL